MIMKQYYTFTQLIKVTGAPGYLIRYLYECGRLPIVKESRGHGYSRHYHPDCVDIIKEHIEKSYK